MQGRWLNGLRCCCDYGKQWIPWLTMNHGQNWAVRLLAISNCFSFLAPKTPSNKVTSTSTVFHSTWGALARFIAWSLSCLEDKVCLIYSRTCLRRCASVAINQDNWGILKVKPIVWGKDRSWGKCYPYSLFFLWMPQFILIETMIRSILVRSYRQASLWTRRPEERRRPSRANWRESKQHNTTAVHEDD
jgi:hypothetical protein